MLVRMAATVVAVSAVATVHEDVHQRTGQQQQEWQRAEKVGTVLVQKEIAGDSTHDEQADRITGTPERLGVGVVG